MKKTEYFTSSSVRFNELNNAVEDAKKKRDAFIAENKLQIAKIDSEDIKVVSGNPANNYLQNVMVIIRLTFYPKQ
ncbi:hypothetical protein AB9K26_05810 [Psychroserpens sp. XS_ASV72]|uniref:hypothetical protein n=1 Tax=Psychroserpens sp. XS_ASV72 TaxID=3241293 RepID=UPI00351714F0